MDSNKTAQTTPAETNVDNVSVELDLQVRRARTVRTGVKAGGTLSGNGVRTVANP